MKRRQRYLTLLILGCVCLIAGCKGKEKAETAKGSPQITIESESIDKYNEDNSEWLLHSEYDTITVSKEGYETVSESVNQWMEETLEEIHDTEDEYAEWALEDEAFSTDNDYYRYSIFQSIGVARADQKVISLTTLISEYTGGVHGNYGTSGITFDVESGKVLELTDILKDAASFREESVKYIIKYLENSVYSKGLIADYADTVENIWTRDEGPNWYMDASGITMIFNPYEIGPYAMGEVYVTLPYSEFSSSIKEEYADVSSVGIAKIPKGETVSLFLSDTDSQAEKFRYYQESSDYGEGPVYVELEDSTLELGNFSRTGSAYLLNLEDGRNFVILDADYMSDDFVTFVYEITDGNLQKRDQLEGVSLQEGIVNTEKLKLRMHLDVLGTYNSLMDYTIGEDGKLIQNSEWFEIDVTESPWYLMVTTKELPVWIDGKETTLPVGSHIYITATDNHGTARFINDDTGAKGEISYTRGDGAEDTWTIFIDGIPDSDYFEMVPYAG